jgi:hypothetical protein
MITEMLPEGWFIVHDHATAKPKKDKPGAPLRVRAASVDAVWGYGDATSTIVMHGAYLAVTESAEEVLALVARHTPAEVGTP